MNNGKPLVIGTITQAMKAQQILRAQGIASKVVRTPHLTDGSGCGYSVVIFSQDIQHAFDILVDSGFNPKTVSEGGRRL